MEKKVLPPTVLIALGKTEVAEGRRHVDQAQELVSEMRLQLKWLNEHRPLKPLPKR